MPYAKNGLVPIHKVVIRNGKQHIQTYYVSMDEAKKEGYQHHMPKKEGKDALQKLLRQVRKQMGSSDYRDMLKENGIKWDESPHDGANTMRASMAAYEHLMNGNHLDLERTGKSVDPKLVVDLPKKPMASNPTPAPKPNPVPVINTNNEPPKSSQPTGQPDPTQSNGVPQVKEPALNRLIQRLGLPYDTDNGKFIIGLGHKEVTNKWGRPETAPGSIRMAGVEKAPASQASRWGDGHFIRLDSNFMDKDTIKDTLDGKYNPDNKKWYISFKQLVNAIKTFKNIEISSELTPTIKQVMEKVDVDNIDLNKIPTNTANGNTSAGGTRADKDIDISNFITPNGIKNLELYPHQKKGVKFLLENKKATLGLAVGLGKTPSAIVAVKQLLNDKKIQRALVIAPSSVKYNWKSEVEKFSDMKVSVLESKDVRKNANAIWNDAKNSDIIVINYDMLRKPEIREKLAQLAPNCVIADEAHKLKNGKAQQTKGFKDSWKNSEYKFFLSATPFPNGKPQETYTILNHLRPDVVGKWKDFGHDFVVWESSRFGAKPVMLKNIDKLKDKMADVVFMRNHNSPDVTTNLPKERHVTFQLEMTDEQKKMYKAIANDISSELKQLEKQGVKASTPAMIAKFKKLEQVAIDPDMLIEDKTKIDMNKLYPKEEWAVQTIADHLEEPENRGVIVFCDMKLPLDKLKQGLINEGVDPTKIAYITGDVKPEERTAIQEKMKNGDVKVALCTNAAEEGVNLQHGAHTLIHLDQPWVPKAITQREGRVLRTGQPSPYTNFLSPLMTGTVEDRKRSTLANKVGTIEELLGAGTAGSVANNIKAETKGSSITLDDLKKLLSF